MAMMQIARPQTTAEAFGPVVKDLFAAIDQSKKLRGERLQVESVFKSLNSLDPTATPEERAAAITGGLQATRAQARTENTGFLSRIIEGLNPRVPSFEGVTPIEKFMAEQQLNLALQDPLIRRGREAGIASSEASAEASRARAEYYRQGGRTTTAEKGYTQGELGLTLPTVKSAIDSVKSSFSPGSASRTTDEFIQAFRDRVIGSPIIGWQNQNTTKQKQIWNLFKGTLANEQANQKGGEISFDLGGQAVRDFEMELFGETRTEPTGASPTSSTATGTPPARVFVPVGATDAEMETIITNLNPESAREYNEVHELWEESMRLGNVAVQKKLEEWLTKAVEIARKQTGSFRGRGASGTWPEPTNKLPVEYPIGMGIPTFERRSSASQGSRAAELPQLRGTRQ